MIKPLKSFLCMVCLFAGMACVNTCLKAEPRIDISFESSPAGDRKLLRAYAVFPGSYSVVFNVFKAISAYPSLHQWIENTTVVSKSGKRHEFNVEFKFPWPVGQRWSRVGVRFDGNTIFWVQLEGNLEANSGSISFLSRDNKVLIDYRAAIDIGLPDLLTQSYKKKFVREFLQAACERVETVSSALASATLQ